MRITWKDGVTTLAAAGAIVLDRAYFHNWDWPLVSSMSWVIVGLAALTAVGMLFSYVLDDTRSSTWSWVTGAFAFVTAALTGLGLYYTNSDYVVLLMLSAVTYALASIVRHVTVSSPVTHIHVS